MRPIRNKEDGFTLVEVLAALAISSLIILIAYSLFFATQDTYERVTEENDIRKEADYLMASLINEFFTLRSSEIIEEHFPEEGTANYFLKTKKGNLGIIDHKLFIKGEPIPSSNPNIYLADSSKIKRVEKSTTDYEIILVLKSKKTGRTLELTSILNVINDREENSSE